MIEVDFEKTMWGKKDYISITDISLKRFALIKTSREKAHTYVHVGYWFIFCKISEVSHIWALADRWEQFCRITGTNAVRQELPAGVWSLWKMEGNRRRPMVKDNGRRPMVKDNGRPWWEQETFICIGGRKKDRGGQHSKKQDVLMVKQCGGFCLFCSESVPSWLPSPPHGITWEAEPCGMWREETGLRASPSDHPCGVF